MLAEQPPNDMAGMLSMFQHVNPVLRRRLKDLLETIREAAKEVAVIPSVEATSPVPVAKPDAMHVDEPATEDACAELEKPPDRLWPTGMSF